MFAWGKSDIGMARKDNQDSYVYSVSDAKKLAFAVVCDGMGGAAAGNIVNNVTLKSGLVFAGLKNNSSYVIKDAENLGAKVFATTLELGTSKESARTLDFYMTYQDLDPTADEKAERKELMQKQ